MDLKCRCNIKEGLILQSPLRGAGEWELRGKSYIIICRVLEGDGLWGLFYYFVLL